MKDESLDDVLCNIEPETNDKEQSRPVEPSPEDDQFNQKISIDFELPEEEFLSAGKNTARGDESSSGKLSNSKNSADIKTAGQKKDGDRSMANISPGISTPAVKFTVKGTRTWNTREPYIISINNDRLKENYDDLAETIYFVDSPENESSIQGKIKLSLLRNISGDSKELVSKYKEFLYRLIINFINEISHSFPLKDEKQKLFIYHTGAYTLYRILIASLQSLKIGHCYKRIQDNRVTRFFPSEYIKVAVLNWYEDNINIFNLPFDGIHEFNDLKRIVTSEYYYELEKYNKKMDELVIKLNLSTDKKFNREEYMKNKWDEWFGSTNIVIYNRFIERTIFKFSERHIHR